MSNSLLTATEKANNKNILLLDMDDTIVDFRRTLEYDLAMLEAPIEKDNPNLTAEQRYGYIVHRQHLIKNQPNWWKNLPELELGFEIYNAAREIGFEIHILTKGPYSSERAWMEKVEWCREHLHSDVNITISGDKSLVYGKVLVDDWSEYMNGWLEFRPRGLGIMVASETNREYYHPNVIRYTGENYWEMYNALEQAFYRNAGEELDLLR